METKNRYKKIIDEKIDKLLDDYEALDYTEKPRDDVYRSAIEELIASSDKLPDEPLSSGKKKDVVSDEVKVAKLGFWGTVIGAATSLLSVGLIVFAESKDVLINSRALPFLTKKH